MRLPDEIQRKLELEKFRAELRKITDKLIADLRNKLGLDQPWTKRG